MILHAPYNKEFMTDVEEKIKSVSTDYAPGKQLLDICNVLRLRQKKDTQKC